MFIAHLGDFDPEQPFVDSSIKKKIDNIFELYNQSHFIISPEKYKLSFEQQSLLLKFHDLFKEYISSKTEVELDKIYLDADWKKMQKLATEVDRALRGIYIREAIIDCLFNFADKKYQERIWIKGLGPECDSYTESYIMFFEEFELIEDRNYIPFEEYMISNQELEALRGFAKHLKEFEDEYGWMIDKEIIHHPEWSKIQNHALQVLKIFGRI